MSVYVVAEAGVNHNGSLDMALELIDAAAEARADAVKFQTFRAEDVIRRGAAKARYQQDLTDPGESQLEMVRKLELGAEAHQRLMERCAKRGLEFLSTPFDAHSLDFLVELGVRRLKLPSGEITNGPLLLRAARTGLPVILSTGMSSLGDVEQALAVLAFGYAADGEQPGPGAFQSVYATPEAQAILRQQVCLLHCTTEYPAPLEDVNLRAMDVLATAFGLEVGYSDHTLGVAASLAAVARGARVVEKHLTLDRNLPGPDHKASIEPDGLADLVRLIREVERCLGQARKLMTPSEAGNAAVARKSLVAATAIRAGEAFTTDNLTAKRPGAGRSPMEYWHLLGQPASRAYAPDEGIA